MAGSKLAELDNNSNEYSQHDNADFLTEIKLANQAHQTCREPPNTPACVGYANLLASSQFVRNNFYPRKRLFKKTLSAQENEPALLRHLNLYWGHADFRGPQLDICMSVMRGDDVLAVMPTGLGKSVCFQVPAVTLEFGVTIVLSPLVALMQDQVLELKSKGIKAEMLFEKSTPDQLKYIKRQLGMGHPEVRLLYMTPETLFSNKIRAEIQRAYEQKQLNRLVVDEAHVIQEWGTTFRSVYRELGQFRERFKEVPISAFTASAAEDTRAYIRDTLGMRSGQYAQWVEPFNRKNLFYEVRYQGAARQEEQVTNLADFIHRYRPEAYKRNMANGVQAKTVSGLVYCRRRATCEEIANELVKRGIKARAFHAKLSDERRNALLAMWKDGAVECIVATIAFGMGVDQAHVRYVVHYDMPKTFEGFYQETGRAGRDGHISRCILFYSREDARYLRSQAGDVSSDPTARTKMSEKESLLAKTRMLNSFKAHFAEDNLTCRHVTICRYFGEIIDATKQEVLEAYCNRMCDVGDLRSSPNLVEANVQVCSNPGAVKRRAFALTEDIDVCSQAVRPVISAPDKDDATRLAAVQEATQEDTVSPSAPLGTLGSLRVLYGTAAKIASDPAEDEPPLRRYGGLQQAPKRYGEPHLVHVGKADGPSPASGTPGASLDDLHGSALLQQDIVENREEWMDWPESGKSRRASADNDRAQSSVIPASVTDQPILGQSRASRVLPTGREPSVDVSNSAPVQPSGPAADRSDASHHAGPSRRARSPVVTHQEPIWTFHVPPRAPAMMAGHTSYASETPCPRSNRRGGSNIVRTGPSSLLNSSRPSRPAMTVDMHDFGQYAVAETGETDPDKVKRQKDAFRAVTPITGRGPFSYYTNTAPPMTGRKRKLSTAQQQGSSFRTPFKQPYLPDREYDQPGMISVEDRQAALRQIKEAIRKSVVDGPEADRLWACWEWGGTRREGMRDASVDVEAFIVNKCHTLAMLREQTEEFIQAVRILRVAEGADIIVKQMFDEFDGDPLASWLRVLDEVMRAL